MPLGTQRTREKKHENIVVLSTLYTKHQHNLSPRATVVWLREPVCIVSCPSCGTYRKRLVPEFAGASSAYRVRREIERIAAPRLPMKDAPVAAQISRSAAEWRQIAAPCLPMKDAPVAA